MKTLALVLFASLAASAQEENIPLITVAGRTLTNATLRVLNSSNAVISSGTTGAKIKLSDLPEPWRSKYYDETKINRERAVIAAAEEKRIATIIAARKEQEAKLKAAEVEKSKPLVLNEWIEASPASTRRDESGCLVITGKIRSLASSHTLKRISVQFDIFDSEDNKVGTANDYISTLEPGATWKYEATTFSKGGRYRLGSITCSDGRLY